MPSQRQPKQTGNLSRIFHSERDRLNRDERSISDWLRLERSRLRWKVAAILGWVVAAYFLWCSLGEIARLPG